MSDKKKNQTRKGRNIPTKADLVKSYLDKYINKIKDGSMTKKGLARILFEHHPLLFISVEEARREVRRFTGACGSSHRKIKTVNKNHIFISNVIHALPKSKAESKTDYNLTLSKHILVFSDVHIPFQTNEAIEVMVEFVKTLNPQIDAILINGDLIDFYGISRYDKNPTKPKLVEEIECARDFFDYLRYNFATIPIYYKLGNHEERWEKFLFNKAVELFGLDGLSLENILNLKDYDIELISSKQLIKYGKLNILHGHEMGESLISPVNPARGVFLKTKSSTLIGHNHQTSHHQENNLNNEIINCYSTGCLCELTPEYRPFAYTKWNHGFSTISLDDEGNFSVSNYRINNKKVYL